jgi:predicted ATPase
MITNIHIENFKSIKFANVPIRPLTVLMGLNSSGKSSFLQVFLLISQSSFYQGQIDLAGYLIDVGKMRDIFYEFEKRQSSLAFGIDFNNLDEKNSLLVKFNYKSDAQSLRSVELLINEAIVTEETFYRSRLNNLEFEGILNKNIQYLEAERFGPKDIYDSSYSLVSERKQVGKKGEYAVHYLTVHGNEQVKNEKLYHPDAKSNTLLHQVDAWLSTISPGVRLNVTEFPGSDKIILNYQYETNTHYTGLRKPKNVGFGISYTLPIIVAILAAPAHRLLIIENPEAHIHPKGQAELGKLMALAAESGLQLIVETHSDHIVNGVRVAVKKGDIDRKNTVIHHFERINKEDEQYSEITPIYIDNNGSLSDYPKGFLDQWGNLVSQLI